MSKKPLSRGSFWVVTLLLIAGLILTLVSFANLCTEECQENHNWRLFNLPFEPFGIAFFITALSLHLLSKNSAKFLTLTTLLLFSGVGAEITFIWVQHAKIGSYCPVCLSIAATIFLSAAILARHSIKQTKTESKESPMKRFQLEINSTLALLLTSVITFFGVSKVDAFQDLTNNISKEIAFGNEESDIEGYLFTDWACPACRKIEPNIDSIMNAVTKDGKFYFVDHVIHPETLNYIPYNLSFMINNKDQYVKLRHMLTKLSKQTSAPTEEQIAALASSIGANFDELDYANVAMGIKYFKTLGNKFSIKGTPTLVLINKETKKGKRLTGSDDITATKINKAIRELKS